MVLPSVFRTYRSSIFLMVYSSGILVPYALPISVIVLGSLRCDSISGIDKTLSNSEFKPVQFKNGTVKVAALTADKAINNLLFIVRGWMKD